MISRRNLLTGLSLLPLAGGIAGCSARASIGGAAPAPGGQIPVVGPGPRWNGTPLTGGTPPTDPVRTTAKPAVQWWQPSELRMSTDVVIGVDADAKGGVAYVDFWVEGTVQRVTQSLYADTDVNGKARKRLGYWISLNASAFKAISINGAARIFATATPNDPSMQARTIGYPAQAPNGVAGGTDGNRTMTIYPRAVAHDFVKTVGASGDYATLDAALAAIKTANAESAQLTLLDSAFYEMSTVTGARFTGAKGFHTIQVATGKAATIGRSTFPSGAGSTFPINPLMECLEFRGSNLTIDFKNFSTFGDTTYSRGHLFNGCVLTNSMGRDSLYWNKGSPQIPANGNPVPGYVIDCTITELGSPLANQLMVTGCLMDRSYGRVLAQTPLVANTYIRSLSGAVFRNPILTFTLAYSGPGSATITKSGDNSTGPLILAVNGATVKSYSLGQIASDTWYDTQAIVNDINSSLGASGWTAVFHDNSMRSGALKDESKNPNGFTNTAVTSAPINLYTWFDVHSGVDQFRTSGSASCIRENLIRRGLQIVGVGDAANAGFVGIFFDGSSRDVVYTDCALSAPTIGGSQSASWLGTSSNIYSHVYFRNVTNEMGYVIQKGITGDKYCCLEQCIMGNTGWDSANGPTPYTFKDCYIGFGFQGPSAFTAIANTGDTLVNSSLFNLSTLCVDPANGNFTPKAAMPMKSSVGRYDCYLNPRATNDAIGAVALGATNPSRPF